MENKGLNKRGLGYLSLFFVSSIIFSLIIITMMMYYGSIIDTQNGYGYETIIISEKFNTLNSNITDTFNEIITDTTEMQEKFTTSDASRSSGVDSMVVNSFSMVKDIFRNSFKIMHDILGTITTDLGIYPVWYYGIIGIIIIVIFVTVLAGFLRASLW